MTGGFGNWNGNMADIGPLYPFPGSEVLMVILLLAFWVVWHVVQVRTETRQHESEAEALRHGDNLLRVVQQEHTLERM